MSEWIDANKQLPAPYEKVLVIQEDGKQAFAFRAPKIEKRKLELYEVYEGSVVKWRSLEE